MHIFFVFLASITTVFFSTSLVFATLTPDRLYHFYFGLIAAVSCLLTHCWVFFYFIGTGEGIRDAVLEHHLDEKHIKHTKRFKGKAFPSALFSMIFVIVGSTMGGALRVGRVSTTTHLGWIFFAILFNFFTFRLEYRTIQENRKLTEKLNQEIEVRLAA